MWVEDHLLDFEGGSVCHYPRSLASIQQVATAVATSAVTCRMPDLALQSCTAFVFVLRTLRWLAILCVPLSYLSTCPPS
jgi:hypothetical protein